VADEFPLEQGIPDVDDPGTGFLWDNLARRGVTYRIYGSSLRQCGARKKRRNRRRKERLRRVRGVPGGRDQEGDPLPRTSATRAAAESMAVGDSQMQRMRPTKAALRDHYDPLFPDFETDYPDNCGPTSSCGV